MSKLDRPMPSVSLAGNTDGTEIMTKVELISLLKLIIKPPLGTTEDEHTDWILRFEDNVPHPSGYDVDINEELSLIDIETESDNFNSYIEAVVNKALSYKPIILPQNFDLNTDE